MTGAEVLRPGPLTTIQDLGRPGLAHLGVPHSGAADPAAARLANLLAGNDESAALLETTLMGPALRFDGPGLIALTGAPAAATLAGRPIAFGEAISVAGGELLDVGAASVGVRSYIALAGGIDGELVLGSRATDTLTGLGPAPLAKGDRLEIGAAKARGGPGAGPRAQHPPRDSAGAWPEVTTLRVTRGPRADHFDGAALDALVSQPFTVSPTSNRIGVRLSGPRLTRAGDHELPSEGLLRGAVQVPPAGDPILMLADHPTTGGYPVIAVVVEADLGPAAQLRPGVVVRFRPA